MAALRAGAAAPKPSAPLVRIPPMSAPCEGIWRLCRDLGEMGKLWGYTNGWELLMALYVVYGTLFVHVVCVRYYNVTHDFRTKPCEKTT